MAKFGINRRDRIFLLVIIGILLFGTPILEKIFPNAEPESIADLPTQIAESSGFTKNVLYGFAIALGVVLVLGLAFKK